MAIKRLDPKAVFKVISQHDTAIETETQAEMDAQKLEPKEGQPLPPAPLTRYEKYCADGVLDESALKFKDGQKPDRFLLRALTADETADINGRHVLYDTVNKRLIYPNRNKMFLEIFRTGFIGIESADGTTSKPDLAELEFDVQVELGALIHLMAALGKNEKKS